MKGVDYNKALSREREYFQDTIKKTQESADKRIADTEERTEGKVNKQRETFIEDKADLESSYQSNIEKLNDKTRKSLESNNDNFHNEREKERQAFTQDSITKRKDFDQRLNDIKSSYKKSFESEKDTSQDLQSTAKKKYDKSISDTRNQSDESLENYRNEMIGQGAHLKDQYNRERQQLVRSHEDHTTAIHKDSAYKRAELKDHLRTDFQKSKEVQEADFEQQKQYTGDRMTTMQKKFEDRNQKMAKDYSQRSDNLVETQQRESVRVNRENRTNLTDARRDFNKQLRLIDLDKKRRDNGSGEFSEVMDRQQGLRDATVNDNRFKELKEKMNTKQRLYEDKYVSDQAKFNETLRTESAIGTANLDRKLNETNAAKIVEVSKEREKAEEQVTNRATQNRIDRAAFEQQMNLERRNSSDRLTKLKENFNSAMKQMEEKHQASVGDVTIVSNKDKAAFVKNMTENRNKEIFEMKREFTRLMDQTVQDYEIRLNNYQRDNEYLKMTMDQKVQNITDIAAKQIDSQRTLFEDRRAADIKDTQVLVDQKENHWKTAANHTNIMFQKKIDKMQIEQDTKLKLLTNDYENKLKEIKAITTKELAQKDTHQQIELERIKMAYRDEKANMVTAFENQIQDIKTGHRDQMDSMKNFKKLS
ncbi:MAG: hypothetical protein H0V66_02070 [Bdellovibrionales bacterium]|nr:hypothetical protein [Bdellovibrionales bacterium]